ncbi:PREDICTED: protein CARMIL-like [Amphimedon queenslandica]|uniref:Uncharacterized protein n=1 Tax=Amphimedon queenslandica TaxID=400682 RepID=A0AAN0IS03_AMPQE|nr:PREDICTED: protein CARMIL-like [Amphimedon queenslandica]|eukprot:XP_011408042.2 PREDICTED: protein CARMIL-like [Amphimedon queenslandica]
MEEVVERENILKQYLKETDSEELSYEELSEADESLDTGTSIVQEDGEVEWSQDGVHLLNPSVDQCMEVITKLEDKHEIVTLIDSSSDSIQFLIPTILEGRTIRQLTVSSFLTHDDILSFITQLSTNKSLTMLQLSNDSISDDGVVALAQSLQYNETLKYLHLQYNPDITSACAQSIAKLLNNNKTLTYLYLYDTNIDSHGAVMLSESLQTNNTLKSLWLDRQHQNTCSALPYFEQIKSRIKFW